MGLLDKIPFFKHKEVPIPEQDNFENNMDLSSQDPLNDKTGFGNIGSHYDDQLGLPSENSSSIDFTSPTRRFEPIQETPASQPSSFEEFNKRSLNKNEGLQTLSKNIEVISSKIDTIRAILDNLSQKIEKIEKIAEGEKEDTPKRNYGW
jgi:hypothetical protein